MQHLSVGWKCLLVGGKMKTIAEQTFGRVAAIQVIMRSSHRRLIATDANSPSLQTLLHLWICPLPPKISSVGRPMIECRYELSLHGAHCWLAWENYFHSWRPRGWTWVEVHFLPCKDKEDTWHVLRLPWVGTSKCLGQQLKGSQDNSHMHCTAKLICQIGSVRYLQYI